MRAALLIIDLQKAYYRGDMKASMDKASYYINAVIPAFRERSLPIVWIQHIDGDDGAVPGTEGFDFIDSLTPGAEDYRVQKKYNNSFNKTDLREILEKEKADIVLISGFCAEYCVLSTYRGALDEDLTPILLKNGIASGSRENIGFVENISDIITIKTFLKMIR
jgi:nicotinamidase-related amidase